MYNPLPDLLVMGALLIGIGVAIKLTTSKPEPMYHMVDQAKRWGYK